ncbi:MAG: hypothetical protein GY913_31910 [Proteobacteria bacterium]|nr:hypothetical protein [Pseudomonadota bacterium]MCP4921526.1 hypothetical protein [Pseudomonadota bacterium]
MTPLLIAATHAADLPDVSLYGFVNPLPPLSIGAEVVHISTTYVDVPDGDALREATDFTWGF